MLVEFQRVNSYGDVDHPPKMIGIDPNAVGAVHDSTNLSGVSIIRLYDGRGYLVKGSYAEIKARLGNFEPDPADHNEDNVRQLPHSPSYTVESNLEGSEVDDD